MPEEIVPNVQHESNGDSPQSAAAPRRRRPANVTVRLGEASEPIGVEVLLDPDARSAWRQRLTDYDGEPCFCIRDLHALQDDARFQLFTLITGHDRHTVTIGCGRDGESLNLFDAVLNAVADGASIEQSERLRRAAIEAAAFCHPSALPFACKRIADRFRDAGLGSLLPQSLVKQARALLGDAEGQITAEQAAQELIASLKSSLLVANPDDFDEQTLADGPAVAFYDGEFYQFVGTHWRKESAAEFRARVAGYLQGSDHGNQVTRKFIGDAIANLEGMALVPKTDQSLPFWLGPEVPTASPFISFSNGLVNLEEALQGQFDLYEFDPRHFSTTVLPYAFDPTAICPLWLQTLREILRRRAGQNPRSRRMLVLQEFFGYALMPHCMKFAKCLVLFGDGANGKSTIMTIFTEFLGTENVSQVPIEKIGQEFWLARMIGMLANVSADLNWVDRISEGMFKALVSGDRVDANRKNLPQIPMKPTAKLMFGTNTLPAFHDRSDGIWRRLISMPLLSKFDGEHCDPDRVVRLREELPGIFFWALVGARRLLRQGGFTACGVCQAALDQHHFDSDPIRQFLDECTLPEGCVLSAELYGAYREWCTANGRKSCSSAEFGKQLLAIAGIGRGRETVGRRPRTYTGIRLVRHFVPELPFERRRHS